MDEFLKRAYKKINVALAEKDKSITWLAGEMGLSVQAVSSLLIKLKKGENVTTDSLEKIEKALGVNFFK